MFVLLSGFLNPIGGANMFLGIGSIGGEVIVFQIIFVGDVLV